MINKIFLVLCFVGFFSGQLFAQSLTDIQNLKVDNLSDAQVEQLIKRAESSGMNQQQLEAYAAERGMPGTEVAKLRQRIESLRLGKKEPSQMGAMAPNTPKSGELFQIDPKLFDSLRMSDPYYDLTTVQKRIFGYKLFHNKNLTFSPSMNLPTPKSYVVGTGDQLLIDVYGVNQQSYDLIVNNDGKILIPNLGPIQVGGATMEAATSRIKTSLARIYSAINSGSSFVDVRIGNIRSIKVSMVGELNRPGTYTLPSFASVFNALFAAGGPNEKGSFRNIQVYRNNKLITTVDVYDFLVNGESSQNMILSDNDVVIVQPVSRRVELTGPVRRDGFFEMKDTETVEDLLRFAGGFESSAYTRRLTVKRTNGSEYRVEDIDQTNFGEFLLRDGDVLAVGELLNRFSNRVQISGAVFRPGDYSLPESGLKVSDLVAKAEGLRGDAFTGRAVLYRTKSDLTLETLSLDIAAILENRAEDVQLRREDVLNIPSIFDLREEYYIRISGDVNAPGSFNFAEKITLEDLIIKAGGLKESASESYIEIARRVKNDFSGKVADIITVTIDKNLSLSEKQIELMPFDHVFIRRSPGFQREKIVEIQGEVFFPGEYALSNANERISDVIKRAGGLNQFAFPKGATLIRRTEYFRSPTEIEIKGQNLMLVKENLQKNQEFNNEAQEIASTRVEERLTAKEDARLKKDEKERQNLAAKFRAERIQDVSVGGAAEQVTLEFNQQELIGIDLVEILKNPGSSYDLILEEGDILRIPKELQTVRMRGEVLFPTTARYQTGRGFRSYITRAGGFTEDARRKKSYVVYANGDVKRTRSLGMVKFYPHMEPGAEIIVPRKPEKQPMTAQQWVAIGSGLATLGLVIVQIINLTN